MNSAWSQPQVQPQLEEYIDHPGMLDVNDQGYLSGQSLPSSQSANFPAFGSQFPARSPQSFNFSPQQPPNMNSMYNDRYYDHSAAALRDPSQVSTSYRSMDGSPFGHSPSTSFSESTGVLQGGDPHNPQGSAYAFNERQFTAGLPSLQMGSPPDAGVNAHNQQLYVSTPSGQHFGHHRTYSNSPSGPAFDLPQDNAHAFFGADSLDTKPDPFGHGVKRHRADDGQEDQGIEQDAESKEPAKAKP